jgi:hypothetical protein
MLIKRNMMQETFQVMGDPATAMRDPVFYRWHAFIDDVFQEHKNTLPRYNTQQVNYIYCDCELITNTPPSTIFLFIISINICF